MWAPNYISVNRRHNSQFILISFLFIFVYSFSRKLMLFVSEVCEICSSKGNKLKYYSTHIISAPVLTITFTQKTQ